MKATVPWAAAVLGSALATASASAGHYGNPYYGYPRGDYCSPVFCDLLLAAPDLRWAPMWYSTSPEGMTYGPNYYLYPPLPPFNGAHQTRYVGQAMMAKQLKIDPPPFFHDGTPLQPPGPPRYPYGPPMPPPYPPYPAGPPGPPHGMNPYLAPTSPYGPSDPNWRPPPAPHSVVPHAPMPTMQAPPSGQIAYMFAGPDIQLAQAMNPNAPRGYPPGMYPPGAYPPGAYNPGAYNPGAYAPRLALAPGAVPPGGFPPTMPPRGFSPGLPAPYYYPNMPMQQYAPSMPNYPSPYMPAPTYRPNLPNYSPGTSGANLNIGLPMPGYNPYLFETNFAPNFPSTGYDPNLPQPGYAPNLPNYSVPMYGGTGGKVQTAFPYHPYVRSPRDFFMWRENMEDQARRDSRTSFVP